MGHKNKDSSYLKQKCIVSFRLFMDTMFKSFLPADKKVTWKKVSEIEALSYYDRFCQPLICVMKGLQFFCRKNLTYINHF